MLDAFLLFKKIYSNAKVSSGNELMLCLSALPSLVSRDLFLMLIQVNADSFCCGALAVHRALPGPRIAWQRTFGDGVLYALLIEEPGSQGNLEAVLCSSLLIQAVTRPGFQVCVGWVKAMAVPAQIQTSPITTGGTPCSLWNMLSSMLEPYDHHPWHRAALQRQCAHAQEEGLCTFKRKKITPNTFLTLNTTLHPPRRVQVPRTVLWSFQQGANYNQKGNFSPQMYPNWRTHGCVKIRLHQPVWSSVPPHTKSLCKLATTSPAALEQW